MPNRDVFSENRSPHISQIASSDAETGNEDTGNDRSGEGGEPQKHEPDPENQNNVLANEKLLATERSGLSDRESDFGQSGRDDILEDGNFENGEAVVGNPDENSKFEGHAPEAGNSGSTSSEMPAPDAEVANSNVADSCIVNGDVASLAGKEESKPANGNQIDINEGEKDTSNSSEIESTIDGENRSISVCVNDLIDQHAEFLFGYAYRLSGNAADAEDLVQQTFLITHQKLYQLRSRESAKSWLCTILRSCWLKTIRRNQPVPVSNYDLELEELLEIDLVDSEVDCQAVQQVIDELPDEYRLVLLMYYFEELSYQEISEKLDVKIGTVMSRLSRAKDRFRRKLGKRNPLS